VIDPTVVKFNIQDSDLKIEWYSGTGCGGQHKNKHQNSCRITHLPSGIVTTAQTRDRTNSLKLAKQEIIKRVSEVQTSIVTSKTAKLRKDQVGSGMRGDKIRTIRFQDNTAVDHITSKRTTAEKFMKGFMDVLWN
jgi:peptide chain release factor 1